MCREELTNAGYAATEEDPFKLAVQLNNYKSRLPEKRIRNVHRSSELTFDINQESALNEIERRIKGGETLQPYLSRRLTDLDYNDPMLNDWGLYHLHLGTVLEPDGFINRTGPLLFAYFDNENSYLLAIGSHNSWTDKNLMEILHRDFPNAIERFKSPYTSAEDLTTSDIKALRPRTNYILTLSDGTSYFPVGGGVTTSGSGIRASTTASHYLRLVKIYEDIVQTNLLEIGELVKDKLSPGYTELDIHFYGWNNSEIEPLIEERKTGAIINIGNLLS